MTMGILPALIAVMILILIPWAAVQGIGLTYLFGVIIPYAALSVFFFGTLGRIIQWARIPNPFRIPTTGGQQNSLDWVRHARLDNPYTTGQVMWLFLEPYENAFPDQSHGLVGDGCAGQMFLLLCNHCENPPCVRVCPTQATFKREEDGIVMIDYHRCIGCRFCMAACPYGSRSFNFRDPRPFIEKINPEYPTRRRGVVEKCNFCQERLKKGRLPACVEACKTGALTFGDLSDPHSDVSRRLAESPHMRRKPDLGTGPSVYYIL